MIDYIFGILFILLFIIVINNIIRLRRAEYNINDIRLSLYVMGNNLSDIKKQLQRDVDRINGLISDINGLKSKIEDNTRLKVLIEAEEAYDIDKDVDMDDNVGIVTAKQLFNDILMRE